MYYAYALFSGKPYAQSANNRRARKLLPDRGLATFCIINQQQVLTTVITCGIVSGGRKDEGGRMKVKNGRRSCHGLNTDETPIVSVFNPCFIRGRNSLSCVSRISWFAARRSNIPIQTMRSYPISIHSYPLLSHFYAISISFLSHFYLISISFLNSVWIKRTAISREISRSGGQNKKTTNGAPLSEFDHFEERRPASACRERAQRTRKNDGEGRTARPLVGFRDARRRPTVTVR